MSRILRPLLSLFTVLALLAGTVQMAYASGQTPAVDEIIICNGHSAVTIGIDADGNATGEIFYCPDCASTALDAVSVQPPRLSEVRKRLSDTLTVLYQTPSTRRFLIELHARGPPLSV